MSNRTGDGKILKVEFKKNNTMMRYRCATFEGMSGGGVLFDHCIVGKSSFYGVISTQCIFEGSIQLRI